VSQGEDPQTNISDQDKNKTTGKKRKSQGEDTKQKERSKRVSYIISSEPIDKTDTVSVTPPALPKEQIRGR